MNIAPAFRISANRADITATLRQRFISLRLTDEAGLDSDTLEITLADHDPRARLIVPPPGAELEVWLGYDTSATRMGLFIVDEIEVGGPPDQMIIRAVAAPLEKTPRGKSPLQTQKTRSWEQGTLLGDMAKAMAAECGLDPAISPALAPLALPHIDQSEESDINLLKRICRDHGAIAKPAGGRLLLAKRGESKTLLGLLLPTIKLTSQDVTSWRATMARRDAPGTVIAIWRDIAAGEDREVRVGSDRPVKRLRHQHPDEASAVAAARAEYEKRERGVATLSLTMPGRPDFMAEGRVHLTGFRDRVDGEWLATRVQHLLDAGGYQCTVDAEVPD